MVDRVFGPAGSRIVIEECLAGQEASILAVVDGRIGRRRWIEIACATPARMFGLYPAKGTICPGSDADIVLYDPNGRTRISAATHHMNMDHSAWEGWEIDGKVDTVISRGTVVVRGDEYLGRKGHGRYVRRGLSDYLV